MNDIDDLPDLDKMILKDFFSNYKNNENKIAIVDGFSTKSDALDILAKSLQNFELKDVKDEYCEEELSEKDLRRNQYKPKKSKSHK